MQKGVQPNGNDNSHFFCHSSAVQKIRSLLCQVSFVNAETRRVVVFELGWGSMGVGELYAIPAMVEGQSKLVSPWGRGLSNSSFMIMKSKAEIFVLQERS